MKLTVFFQVLAVLLAFSQKVVSAAERDQVNTSRAYHNIKNAIELTDESFEIATRDSSNDWLVLFCEYERFRRCRDY